MPSVASENAIAVEVDGERVWGVQAYEIPRRRSIETVLGDLGKVPPAVVVADILEGMQESQGQVLALQSRVACLESDLKLSEASNSSIQRCWQGNEDKLNSILVLCEEEIAAEEQGPALQMAFRLRKIIKESV
jgi:hypothetical protein